MPTTRASSQPFVITSLNLHEINDALLRIQQALDLITDPQGTILSYASLHYVDSHGQVLHGWGLKP